MIQKGFAVISGGLERLFLTETAARSERLRIALLKANGLSGGFVEAFLRLRVEPAEWTN